MLFAKLRPDFPCFFTPPRSCGLRSMSLFLFSTRSSFAQAVLRRQSSPIQSPCSAPVMPGIVSFTASHMHLPCRLRSLGDCPLPCSQQVASIPFIGNSYLYARTCQVRELSGRKKKMKKEGFDSSLFSPCDVQHGHHTSFLYLIGIATIQTNAQFWISYFVTRATHIVHGSDLH